MDLISWIGIGLISGWGTGMVLTGSGYGVIGDILVGIVGSVAGGLLANAIWARQDIFDGLAVNGLVFALFGAVILISAVRLLPRRGLA